MKELYTKTDLAEQLSVSIGTINNHMKSGNLKYLKIGKAVRFADNDVEEWIRTHYPVKYMSKSITQEDVDNIKSSILGE